MEENRDELLEYVKQIRDFNKKRVFWERIEVAILGLFVLAVCSILPLVVSTLNSASVALETATETINSVSDTIDKADSIMDSLTGTISTMETTLNSVTVLVDSSSEQIVEAFNNINSIDFEGLNDAITDLGNVVEPLSKFFKKF